MAAEDFAGGSKGIKVEIVHADHHNKADVDPAITRRCLEAEGVDAIVDVPNESVGSLINTLLRGTKITFLVSSTAGSDFIGKACSPNEWSGNGQIRRRAALGLRCIGRIAPKPDTPKEACPRYNGLFSFQQRRLSTEEVVRSDHVIPWIREN
jgi:hypothetical protein